MVLCPIFKLNKHIILGTPIQSDADYLITDSLFKKVYNIYSRGDRFQKLDMFSSGQFFSERKFIPHCELPELPQKLTQVEIKVTRKPKASGCCRTCDKIGCCSVPSYKKYRNVSRAIVNSGFLAGPRCTIAKHFRSTLCLWQLF